MSEDKISMQSGNRDMQLMQSNAYCNQISKTKIIKLRHRLLFDYLKICGHIKQLENFLQISEIYQFFKSKGLLYTRKNWKIKQHIIRKKVATLSYYSSHKKLCSSLFFTLSKFLKTAVRKS